MGSYIGSVCLVHVHGYHYNFNVAKIILARLPEIVLWNEFYQIAEKVDWKVAVRALIILIVNGINKAIMVRKYTDYICRNFIIPCSGLSVLLDKGKCS